MTDADDLIHHAILNEYLATDAGSERATELLRRLPVPFLKHHLRELTLRADETDEGLLESYNKMAAWTMTTAGRPRVTPEPFRVDHSTGEVALRALELLRRAGNQRVYFRDLEATIDDPDLPPQYASCHASALALGEHLRVAAYYLLDAEASHDALESEPPLEETFPPLPFPQVWIEMAHLCPYSTFVSASDKDDDPAVILGVGLVEVEQSRVWDVFIPYEFPHREENRNLNREVLLHLLALRIRPDGVVIGDPGLDDLSEAAFGPVRQLVVGGAHLITARNAPQQEVALPRPQRRRIEREHKGMRTPRLYFVDIASAGEHEGAGGTGGTRTYSVRWLVRGHWRHIDRGRSFCTCCDPPQIATWVAAYVKGPAGAPWKGRQIRRLAS